MKDPENGWDWEGKCTTPAETPRSNRAQSMPCEELSCDKAKKDLLDEHLEDSPYKRDVVALVVLPWQHGASHVVATLGKGTAEGGKEKRNTGTATSQKIISWKCCFLRKSGQDYTRSFMEERERRMNEGWDWQDTLALLTTIRVPPPFGTTHSLGGPVFESNWIDAPKKSKMKFIMRAREESNSLCGKNGMSAGTGSQLSSKALEKQWWADVHSQLAAARAVLFHHEKSANHRCANEKH
eukprot:6488270-Amphidinium_carterae.2